MAHSSVSSHESELILLELEQLMIREFFVDTAEVTDIEGRKSPKTYSYDGVCGRSDTRLLTLFRGNEKDPIRSSLRRVPRSELSPYEALSYTWGSPEKPFHIFVDGDPFATTASLHIALQRLRKPAADRVLWIDALCINQDDDDEKSSQVSVMHEIFASASRVLCWLGEDKDGDGFQTLRLFRRLECTNFNEVSGSVKTEAQLRSENIPGYQDPIWNAVHRFFERPWFRRGWVVQEVVQARELIMMCGYLEAPLAHFVRGLAMLLRYQGHQLVGTGDRVSAFGGADGFLTMLMEWNLRHRGGNFPCEPGGYIYRSAASPIDRDGGLSIRPQLFFLLQTFMSSVTTDPRDKHYALLGISSDRDEPGLYPDYGEALEATRLRFARFFMLRRKRPNDRRRSLLVFAGFAERRDNRSIGDILGPSWAPDAVVFRSIEGPGNYLSDYTVDNIFCAGGNSFPLYRATADDADGARKIVGSGSRLDVVSRLMLQPQRLGDLGPSEFQKFFLEVDRMILHREKPYPYLPAGETMEDVQWRTLIGGLDMMHNADDLSFKASYERGRRYFETGEHLKAIDVEDEFSAACRDVFTNMGEWAVKWGGLTIAHQICETTNGYIGLVPEVTKLGDEVCIFRGESMPILLRPLESDASKHQVVGACYIHGVMKGEALRLDDWEEQDFVLV